LIHLNGPSGVGKSTLGQRFVTDHMGVLNLDIDRIVPLVGRWEQDFFAAVAPARRLAIAMAEAHLKAGHDVVMPQLVTDPAEAERFEAAAAQAGAGYVEVALIATSAVQVARFRAKSDGSHLDEQIGRAVSLGGGDALLQRIHRQFVEYIAQRPLALHISTDRLDITATYKALLSALGELTTEASTSRPRR
jgi:predicted kinase